MANKIACYQERRIRALSEMTRVLKVGGRALVYAWAKDQNLNAKPSTYLRQQKRSGEGDKKEQEDPGEKEPKVAEEEESFPAVLPIHVNRTNFQHSDLLVPWKNKSENTYHR